MKKSFLIPSSFFEETGRGRLPVFILLLLLATSGKTIFAAGLTQVKEPKENSRMLLLEKLEKGQKLTSDEIRSDLKPSYEADDLIIGIELPEFPDYPEFHGHPDIFINPPHIYIVPDHFEFDEQSMREIKEEISRSLGEIKKEIESVIHSEEMMNFHREMRKWGEEVRRELEKAMREMKTEKEITFKIEGVNS